MTKNDFLAKIRLAAAQHGGRIGLRAFCQETGLPEKQHVQFGFANWNDAVRAAGLASSTFFRPRSDERSVVQAVVGLVSRLNKWPSENELTLERQRDKTFPSLQVIRRLSRSGSLPEKIAAYCPTLPNLAAVLTIVSGRTGAGAEPTDDLAHGYVYLFRHGTRREFKIGKTRNPLRREGQVDVELPQQIEPIHKIKTDDPSGVESYWHRRFETKRLKGEWFELSPADVRAFQRWKKIY
jgi:hypothetical protein